MEMWVKLLFFCHRCQIRLQVPAAMSINPTIRCKSANNTARKQSLLVALRDEPEPEVSNCIYEATEKKRALAAAVAVVSLF